MLWQFLNLDVDEDDSLEDSVLSGFMLMLKESVEVDVTKEDWVNWSSLVWNEKLEHIDRPKDELGGEKMS